MKVFSSKISNQMTSKNIRIDISSIKIKIETYATHQILNALKLYRINII